MNANVDAPSGSGPVLISANVNAIKLTKDVYARVRGCVCSREPEMCLIIYVCLRASACTCVWICA